MDLTIIYSKTTKRFRLGSSLFGGLSPQLVKVLTLVDGKSNAGWILTQLDEVSEKKLALALDQLEKEGYIKLVLKTTADDDWLLPSIFHPMVVEEINLIGEIETKTEKETLLEAERRTGAEEKAQMEDELKVREVVEQIRAKEKTRLEAVRKAKLEAEVHLKEELRAREGAEKIRVQAEAKAKENARLEMERLAREAEEVRKKAEAEARAKAEEKARLEAECIAKEKAENKAKIKAELRSSKEAVRIAKKDEKAALAIQKKAQQAAEKRERTELKRLAREEKEEKARASAYRKRLAGTRTLDIGKWILISMGLIPSCLRRGALLAIKIMLLYLPLIVLLLVGLLHLINLSPLIEPIEKFVAESIGEPLTINEVRVSLWPQPHLLLGDVVVGANSGLKNEGLKIVSVDIFPVTSTLFEKVIVVKSLEIEGMKIGQDNFGQPLQWINSSSKAEHLKIEQINFKKIDLKIRDLELAPFDGKIVLGESREFKSVNMNSADHALSVQITPQGSSYNLALTAVNWPLPVNPKIVFDEIKANGTLNQDQIDFSQIEGSIYGGNITAKAIISWSRQWTASGNFNLYKVNSPQILRAFDSGGSIDGKLNLTGNFSCKSDEAAKLTDDADITANFEIRHGKINGIDLVRAVLSRGEKSLAGHSTGFDKLTGSVRVKGRHFQYRKLLLQTAQFHAQGNLDIQPNQDISGNINTGLVAHSRHLQVGFNLTGKVDNVKQQ